MEKEMIKIIDVDGVEREVERVSILAGKDGMRKYLVYTKGETQKSGNKILYIAKVVASKDGYVLDNIADDDEWTTVKKLMSEIVSK